MNHTVAGSDNEAEYPARIVKLWRGLWGWWGRRLSALFYGSPDRRRWHRWAVHIRYQESVQSDDVYALAPRYFTSKLHARRTRRLILNTSGWAMQDSVIIGAGEEPYFMWLGGSGETNL